MHVSIRQQTFCNFDILQIVQNWAYVALLYKFAIELAQKDALVGKIKKYIHPHRDNMPPPKYPITPQ